MTLYSKNLMSRPKIIAAHITNLTDARYFAAQGVDYLLFDSALISLSGMMEIKEWIEGPAILLRIADENSSVIDEFVLKIEAYAYDLASHRAEEVSHLEGFIKFFESIPGGIVLDGLHYRYYDQNLDLDLVEGLIISGEEELEVGVKSYDSLDDFFDLLDS